MSTERFSTQKLRAYLKQDQFQLHAEAWQRLRDLQIDIHDALYVLQHGMITVDPEFDSGIEQWRFTIQGETVDQKRLHIDFTFVEVDGVLVLTIMNGQ